YQRYLGSRDTLRIAYIDQALAMPKFIQEQYA
ncbi:MAG TPA: TetR family transcriptional regulator, partial [Acinetobacter ursingii]|nr:TetR family transcriptional regulator [Acinetobacter ursingii]